MNIAQAFLPVSASEDVPGPTQCVLIVSGHAVIVERAEKKDFIEKAVADGKVVSDPEDMALNLIF